MKISIMGSGDKIVMGGGDVDSEGARGQKNRLSFRRHKQKVKTKNPDFVQNGFIKVGIVCEIFVKNSIDKKKLPNVRQPKTESKR